METIIAVIVTYNRLEKIQKAYMTACKEPLSGIIIVNNASTDGTKEYLDSLVNSKLTILNCTENTGGAGGFHSGFKCALEKYKADWLLCFDDDAYPQEGIIDKFIKNKYSEEIGGVVSAVFKPDGSICEMNRPSIDPFSDWRIAAQVVKNGTAAFRLNDRSYHDRKQIDVHSGSFVGLFIRSEVIKRAIGLPRKELFLYGEDTIYTLLIRRSGYRLIFNPNLIFFHDNKDIYNKALIYKQVWRVYYSYRNGLEIYRLVAGNYFTIVAIVKLVTWFYRLRLYKDKKLYLKMLWHGYKDGLFRRFTRTHQEVISLGIMDGH